MPMLWCCRDTQVQPVSSGSEIGDGPPGDLLCVTRGVKQKKIILPAAQKLPPFFRKLVLQEFRGWVPIPSVASGVAIFSLGSVILLLLGILATFAAMDVTEIRVRYDNLSEDGVSIAESDAQKLLFDRNGTGYTTDIHINVHEDMAAPVYLFYYVKGMYGAHRRYIRSRSSTILAGASDISTVDESCLPKQYNTIDGKPDESMPENGLINPCGLLAWSTFNDTFALVDVASGEALELNETGLAWPSDVEDLYTGDMAVNFNTEEQWYSRGGLSLTKPMNESDHFLLWMRPTANPDVYHPWARIDRDLPAGTRLKLTVNNRYNSYPWLGEKGVVLTTNTWIGGRNVFVGIFIVVLGGLYLTAAVGLLMIHLMLPAKGPLASMELSWQKAKHYD